MQDSKINFKWTNTKMLEKTVFLQCGPCRGYSSVTDIRSSSSQMCYYVVVLKNLAKFTGTHLHWSLFSTCNLQLHWNRDADTYSFSWLIIILSLWKTSCELALKGKLYEKWWTDIFITIKIYREVDSFFKKTDIARESLYLRIYIYIGSVLRCSSQWFCLCTFYQVK